MVITAISYNKLAVKNVFIAGSYGEPVVVRSTSSPPVHGANWL